MSAERSVGQRGKPKETPYDGVIDRLQEILFAGTRQHHDGSFPLTARQIERRQGELFNLLLQQHRVRTGGQKGWWYPRSEVVERLRQQSQLGPQRGPKVK